MNARFLRDEAARFRGMAEDADREATKLRLLAMAVDYEARARGTIEVTEPNSSEADQRAVQPNLDGAILGIDERTLEVPLVVKSVGKVSRGLKETLVVTRRPVGRPKRE